MFSAMLTDFFVDETDPEYIRNLKIDILTNIATEGNISKILREFNVRAVELPT